MKCPACRLRGMTSPLTYNPSLNLNECFGCGATYKKSGTRVE